MLRGQSPQSSCQERTELTTICGIPRMPPAPLSPRLLQQTCSDSRLGEEDKRKGRARVGEAHDGILAVRIEHAHVVAERVAEALTARAPPQLLESPVATALHVRGSALRAPLFILDHSQPPAATARPRPPPGMLRCVTAGPRMHAIASSGHTFWERQ